MFFLFLLRTYIFIYTNSIDTESTASEMEPMMRMDTCRPGYGLRLG